MTDREPMSGTPECGGDAAAYTLGALEPHEAEAFRAHMQECAVCRDEVEALRGVVQALPMATHQYEVPRGLKRSVMREVRREPVTAGRARSRQALWQRPRRMIAGLGAAAVAAGGVVAGLELTAGTAAVVVTAQVSGVTGSAQLRVTNGHGELVLRHLTPPGHGHV
jgi:anti-sigma-K factor RskA